MNTDFRKFFTDNYAGLNGISMGRPINDHGELLNDCLVNIPLNVLTKHGLITGSTGTGKSRAIQLMIEGLADQGIPVFLSDIKGDMSGFIKPGDAEKVAARAEKLDYQFQPKPFTVNYWGTQEGLIDFRLDLSEIDYVILARLLELNETQESHLGLIMKYAQDNKLAITNMQTLNELVMYLIKYPEKSIGSSKESLGVISRKLSNLEFSNFDIFFGQPTVNLQDLLTGKINVLCLQNYLKEKFNVGNIVSCLLYKLYKDLPEIGDVVRPKLVVFIDEAHQIFENANPSLVRLMVSILKQIRSKGVGLIFNTQDADSLPEEILAQLGLKVQFALRSFSLKELNEIRGVVESFPRSDFYDLKEEIKSLAIGTAFVATLNDTGALLPPVKTVIFPPASFMDALPLEDLSHGDAELKDRYAESVTTPLNLGSSLDNISVSRGGKWQMNNFLIHKQEQAVNRQVNKRNKEIRRFLILILAILGVVALLVFMFLIYSVTSRAL